MKRTRLLASLTLSMSLFSPLVGCGGEVGAPEDLNPPDTAAPQEQPPAPQEQPTDPEAPIDAAELPASEQTLAALGVKTWRLAHLEGGDQRIEGVSADGKVVAAARMVLDLSGSDSARQVLEIEAPAQARVVLDSELKVVEGDAQNAFWQALYRDVFGVPVESGQSGAEVDLSEFNLPAQLDKQDAAAQAAPGEVRAFATEAQRAVWRDALNCYVSFAQEAYNGVSGRPNVCGFFYEPQLSTNVMKVWGNYSPATRTTHHVVAFAGTRPTNVGDWLRDLESETTVTHVSPITPVVASSTMRVGRGWEARWKTQATVQTSVGTNYAADLAFRAWIARNRGDPAINHRLHLTVVGHSLGAVTATLAGYDIAGYMAAKKALHHIQVVSFNAPRLGLSDARLAYQGRLRSCRVGQYTRDTPCLTLKQLTRSFDPVQSLPVGGFAHPVWQTALNSKNMGAPSNLQLTYCPQYNAPARTWNPFLAVANHDLGHWRTNIGSMPGSHLDCLFGSL